MRASGAGAPRAEGRALRGPELARVFYHEASRAQISHGSPVLLNENATRRQRQADVAAGHVPARLLSRLAALAGQGAMGTGVCVHVWNTDVPHEELQEALSPEERPRLAWGQRTLRVVTGKG